MTITLLHGDCRQLLKTLPDRSVQTVVTSPPYFGLRDYGVAGQIGLEATPAEYVAALVEVFREVRRVLRDDGTVWLNLGDSYAGSWGNYGGQNRGKGTQREIVTGSQATQRAYEGLENWRPPTANKMDGLKPKDLIGIPWRVAFALQDDGWYLRSDIIWSKPNPMPESVTDRPTKAHEYLFLLAKRERYYYDAAAVAEPMQGDGRTRGGIGGKQAGANGNPTYSGRVWQDSGTSGTRNRRTVWTIATRPFAAAHFATFPEALVEPCILAGSSAQACEHCGAPWVRVVEKEKPYVTPPTIEPERYEGLGKHRGIDRTSTAHTPGWRKRPPEVVKTTGFAPSCACPDNAGSARSVVLDPFAGSGTVLKVATRLQRDGVGIELNPDYIELQEKRTDGVQVELFV